MAKNTNICPKCSYSQSGTIVECPRCGVIVQKYNRISEDTSKYAGRNKLSAPSDDNLGYRCDVCSHTRRDGELSQWGAQLVISQNSSNIINVTTFNTSYRELDSISSFFCDSCENSIKKTTPRFLKLTLIFWWVATIVMFIVMIRTVYIDEHKGRSLAEFVMFMFGTGVVLSIIALVMGGAFSENIRYKALMKKASTIWPSKSANQFNTLSPLSANSRPGDLHFRLLDSKRIHS